MALLTLNVAYANADKFTASVPSTATIAELKAQIAVRVDVPAEYQRLIHRGRVLKDEQTLESYGKLGVARAFPSYYYYLRAIRRAQPRAIRTSARRALPNACKNASFRG